MTSLDCCFIPLLVGLCLIGWLIQGRRCLAGREGRRVVVWNETTRGYCGSFLTIFCVCCNIRWIL